MIALLRYPCADLVTPDKVNQKQISLKQDMFV